MFSMVVLSAFNVLVLLAPPKFVLDILTLMNLPLGGRYVLLVAAVVNVVVSMAFEEWGTHGVSTMIGAVMKCCGRGRRRVRDGKTYKAVEGGMR